MKISRQSFWILAGIAAFAACVAIDKASAADLVPQQKADMLQEYRMAGDGPDIRLMRDEYKLYGRSPDIRDVGLQVEIALGYNFTEHSPFTQDGYDGGFAGPKDTFRGTIRYVFPVVWRPSRCTALQPALAYTHISHVSAGPPLNDKPEDYIDIFEATVTIHFGCGQ